MSIKPAWRRAIFISVAILIVVFGALIYKNYYLEEQIRQYITETINDRAEGKFELEIGEVSVHLLPRNIYFSDVRFTSNADAGTNLETNVASIAVERVRPFAWIFSDELSVRRIKIDRPAIDVHHLSGDENHQGLHSLTDREGENGNGGVRQITIGETMINGLSLRYFEAEEMARFSIENSNFILNDISFSPEDGELGPESVEKFRFDIEDIYFTTENGLYILSAEVVDFESDSGSLVVHQFQLLPAYEEKEFFDYVGHRTDRIELTTHEITLTGLNMDHAILSNQLIAESLAIDEADVVIFRDKNYPQQESRGRKPLPQEMINSLPIPVYIHDIAATASSIRYEELHEDASERGAVYFTDLDVAMADFTNIDSLMTQYGGLSIETDTKFMNESDLQVQFLIPYQEKLHNIKGDLASTDPQILNSVFEPLAGVRIESGFVESVRFEMQLNDTHAIGNAEVIYDDLHIALVDRETYEKNLIRRVGSFFINTFAVESANQPEDPRPGTVDYEREPEKSVFNYWWKSLQSGLMDSIGG